MAVHSVHSKVNIFGSKASFKGIDVGNVEQRMQRIGLVATEYMKVYSKFNGPEMVHKWHQKNNVHEVVYDDLW
jgi:hypothetical protein